MIVRNVRNRSESSLSDELPMSEMSERSLDLGHSDTRRTLSGKVP